jgi:hypothetical protein
VTVLVGLTNNTQVTINDAQFTGFIESRPDGTAVLRYQQEKLHGVMPVDSIARIDFGYRRGEPFPLSVTLRSGQKLEVWSEARNFVRVRGATETGEVVIVHPDPISIPLRLSTKRRTAGRVLPSSFWNSDRGKAILVGNRQTKVCTLSYIRGRHRYARLSYFEVSVAKT